MLKEIEDDLNLDDDLTTTISEKLQEYVGRASELQGLIDILERQLEDHKTKLRDLMYLEFPAFFTEHGMTEFKTTDGRVFTLKNYVNAKPVDEEKFFKWLNESGNEEFIKKLISIDVKGYDTDLLETVLDNEKLSYTIEKKVHPQSLKAIVRRAIEQGEEIPEDAVNVDTGCFIKLT